ncbi:MAG: hypothetical protein KGZ96_07795 [Clostridia bacterium]|jgi:hypothetical protein|nr:hypothetical protein [Clostridia bacterium]
MVSKNYLKYTITMMVLFFLFLAVGCPKKENPQAGGEQQKQMPEEIGGIERSAVEIMTQADLIPLIERVSPVQAETITFEETILTEVLKREQAGQAGDDQENEGGQNIPKDTEEAWDGIKMTLVELYNQWNTLEPLLAEENVPSEAINEFKEALDNLTLVGTNQDYFGTLTAANQITKYLPQFMEPYANNSTPQATELKYYLRSLMLNAAIDDYSAAWENLNQLKARESSIVNDLEEQDAQDTAEEFKSSLNNLERALDKEDVDLIKINAAIVMNNIMQINEDLARKQ